MDKSILTELINSGKLDSADVSELLNEMKKAEKNKEIELKIKELHTNKITAYQKRNSDGKTYTWWRTFYSGKRLDSSTYDGLMQKLAECYGIIEATPSKYSVRSVFDGYIKFRKKDEDISSNTVNIDIQRWKYYVAGGKRRPQDIKKGYLQYSAVEWIDSDIKSVTITDVKDYFKRIAGGHRMTKRAACGIKSLLTAIWNYAINNGYCDVNPFALYSFHTSGIKFLQPKVKTDEETSFSADEATLIKTHIMAIKAPSVYDLAIAFHFCIDARIGELTALTWADLYLDAEIPYVFIHHQMIGSESDGKKRSLQDSINYTKKDTPQGHRAFPLTNEAIEILNSLKAINGNKKYIFQSEGQLPIATNHYNEYLKDLCRKLGIPPRSSHKIRFYAVSNLYDLGFDEKTIMTLSGHNNLETTRKYNKKIRQQSFSEILSRLNNCEITT